MDMPEIMVSLSEDVPLDLVVLGGGREYKREDFESTVEGESNFLQQSMGITLVK